MWRALAVGRAFAIRACQLVLAFQDFLNSGASAGRKLPFLAASHRGKAKLIARLRLTVIAACRSVAPYSAQEYGSPVPVPFTVSLAGAAPSMMAVTIRSHTTAREARDGECVSFPPSDVDEASSVLDLVDAFSRMGDRNRPNLCALTCALTAHSDE
jgi:hypothetical protein